MALGATIFKASISLANLDKQIYQDIHCTLALHPSETEERMMIRLIAFSLCYEENLEFSNGLSDPSLPDIWKKNLIGDVDHWIEVGQPDEKKLKKASSLSERVSVFTFNSYKSEIWLHKNKSTLKKIKKLGVTHLKVHSNETLNSLVSKTMALNFVVNDKQVSISNDEHIVHLDLVEAQI